mmetsp:Transcript_4872/g.5933  ORF Transcript_4872/g.5933 Transcript_4872/m.5933 type:complete len:379 (+) Transcript_4872:112-1248(+)
MPFKYPCLPFYGVLIFVISVRAFSVTKPKSSSSQAVISSSSLNLFRFRKQTETEIQEVIAAEPTPCHNSALGDVENSHEDLPQPSRNIKDRTATLRFGGKLSYASQPFPIPEDVTTLKDFITAPKNQHVLLMGGNSNITGTEVLDPSSLTPEFVQRWKEQSNKIGGSEPMLDVDRVVRVVPAAIDVFTVRILPESLIGVSLRSSCRLLQTKLSPLSTKARKIAQRMQMVPEYEAVLIDDEPRAEGPAPLVWLFNKIVNGGKNSADRKSEKRKRSEIAVLRVYTEPLCVGSTTGNDYNESSYLNEEESFVFKAESELWLQFDFPRYLMRFFPMGKAKAEDICSKAIIKALELNLAPAIDSFSDLYLASICNNEKADMEG